MNKDTAKALATAILAVNSNDDREIWREYLRNWLSAYPSQNQKIVQGEIYCEENSGGGWTIEVDVGREREPELKCWYADLDDDLLAKINENCSYEVIGMHYRDCGADCVQVLAIGELVGSNSEPPPLEDGYRVNFELLQMAHDNGDLALVSAIRKADHKPVALVCAIQRNDDDTMTPVPFAVMCEGNPFDDFEDPTVCVASAASMKA